MKQDIFGQPTTLEQSQTLDDWNVMLLGFLAHSAQTPVFLEKVLKAETGFALGHAVKGLFYLLLGRRELIEVARKAYRDAQSALASGGATERERHFVSALGGWLDGEPERSVQDIEKVLRVHPDDTLAMKLSHALRFVLGDKTGMRRSVERVIPAYTKDHPGFGYLLGCHAFALEETGDYLTAETTGLQALWHAPDDAWGLHAVAHVHDMTGNARKGLNWLEGRESAWSHCNNFRYHVWWHKALMHLDLGEIDAVLDLYDREVRADRTDDYRDISNGTSMLMRLELDGVDVGDRWEELAELSANRTEDGSLIFADLHYLLALTADHREQEVEKLLNRLYADARKSETCAERRMASPGIEAAQGLRDFGENRFSTAFDHLRAARPDMQLAGGSHAQRDVFERMTIDAGIRAGRLDEAERILNERLVLRAGCEDGYTAARRDLIAAGRGAAPELNIPAQ